MATISTEYSSRDISQRIEGRIGDLEAAAVFVESAARALDDLRVLIGGAATAFVDREIRKIDVLLQEARGNMRAIEADMEGMVDTLTIGATA